MAMNFKRFTTLRPFLVTTLRSENVLRKRVSPMNIQKSYSHDDVPMPFDSLPFTIKSKYSATLAFTFVLGIGLWAPFFILWYSMAKRTL